MGGKENLCRLKEAYQDIFADLKETVCGFDHVFLSNERYIRVSLAPRTGNISSLLLIIFDKPIPNWMSKSKKLSSNTAVHSQLYRGKVPHCVLSMGCVYSGVPIWEIVRSDIRASASVYFSKHMFEDEGFKSEVVCFENFIASLSGKNQKLLLKNISIIQPTEVLSV